MLCDCIAWCIKSHCAILLFSSLSLSPSCNISVLRTLNNAVVYQIVKLFSSFSCSLECPTCDQKVASLNPRRSKGKISSPESTLCADSCSVSVQPPCYRKCRWQVTSIHTYILDPRKSKWADYAAVQALSGKLSGNELTRNSSGNTQSQSSQLT